MVKGKSKRISNTNDKDTMDYTLGSCACLIVNIASFLNCITLPEIKWILSMLKVQELRPGYKQTKEDYSCVITDYRNVRAYECK